MKIILTIIASAAFIFLSIFIGDHLEFREDLPFVIKALVGALVLIILILIIGLIYTAIDDLFNT